MLALFGKRVPPQGRVMVPLCEGNAENGGFAMLFFSHRVVHHPALPRHLLPEEGLIGTRFARFFICAFGGSHSALCVFNKCGGAATC